MKNQWTKLASLLAKTGKNLITHPHLPESLTKLAANKFPSNSKPHHKQTQTIRKEISSLLSWKKFQIKVWTSPKSTRTKIWSLSGGIVQAGAAHSLPEIRANSASTVVRLLEAEKVSLIVRCMVLACDSTQTSLLHCKNLSMMLLSLARKAKGT